MSKIPVENRSTFEVDNTYWRSPNQLADTPEIRSFVEREFQDGASEMKDPVSRRSFLKLMGASAGLAGYAACRRPVEHILPYSRMPEDLVPGNPQMYATVLTNGCEAIGALVETHEGRPTKVEGNPQHPQSLGATDSFMQGSVLGLYDPDRSQKVLRKGAPESWAAFEKFVGELNFAAKQGEGLAILSGAVISPSLARLRKELAKSHPKAAWFTYEAVNKDNVLAGTTMAFGAPLLPHVNYFAPNIIVSLDADFLGSEPGNVLASREFARRRDPDSDNKMNRLYAIEGRYSVTGAAADHRLRVKPSQVHTFARALATALSNAGVAVAVDAGKDNTAWDTKKPFLGALVKDLIDNKGASAVVAGSHQPAEVHALVAAINVALGNNAVRYAEGGEATSLKALVEAIDKKSVETLLVLGGNPVYDAPADYKLADKLKTVANLIHLSEHVDETSQAALWHLPRAHQFETWGDAESVDGTRSIQQPLIMPMYKGRNELEVLSVVAGLPLSKGYDIVRATYGVGFGTMSEKEWRAALHTGTIKGGGDPLRTFKDAPALKDISAAGKPLATKGELEIQFVASASSFDGRYANNAWLQELPDPMTKLTWDNAVMLSPATCKKLGLKTEDFVKISNRGSSIEAAVWEMPGQSDDTIVIALGYGRRLEGVGKNVGFNAYPLRNSDALGIDSGVKLEKANGKYQFANTQDHHYIAPPSLLGIDFKARPVVRESTVDGYKKEPHFAEKLVEHPPLVSLFKEHEYKGHAWGMSIDLNSCTGCNACTIACQAENNIPVVGKDQVRRGREMHWIRLDRYFANTEISKAGEVDTANPRVVHQPMACHQCQNAPCEQVCPVTATSHSPEGLNDMQYSRCVGTRYCSNNCPYKVRRFNFLNFHDDEPEVKTMVYNPDVTVRFRGVMEKCNYCVQRINGAKIAVKLENRPLKDGDITPACAQACPSQSIVFGDINDKQSRVSKEKAKNRNYDLLAELNVKPRTSYLARIRNPHPEIG